MAEAQLQQFLEKVRQLNAFVALSEADPTVRAALAACSSHHEVVNLASRFGFAIGRRWGEPDAQVGGTASLLGGQLPPPGQEHVSVLLSHDHLRLERIHSNQACSPEGFWYDQSEHEWVVLLQGSALLALEGEAQPRALSRGDQLLIPAGTRHRIEATDPDPGTVWLALFWPGDSTSGATQ
ncbi:MAG: Nif11 domain/cupin domain-containing protein [Synechococcaceae bacterium WB9_2_112]|nr:Nif11 domain/cupin domain-containing protein [Synechococcaceae bacterium WB9_2_112]